MEKRALNKDMTKEEVKQEVREKSKNFFIDLLDVDNDGDIDLDDIIECALLAYRLVKKK